MAHPLVKKILYSKEQIVKRCQELGKEVDQYYESQNVKDNTVLLIGILKGCIPFMSELMVNVQYACETDYMVVSSYRGGIKSSGEPKIVLDVNSDLKDRHILIIEDVIDTGLTLDFVRRYFYSRGAKEVKLITLIDKPQKREIKMKADWSGFEAEDNFLVGFGLDYDERLRNLPYVGTCDLSKLKGWKW